MKKSIIFLFLLLTVLLSSVVLAKDYFLYDFEKDKILFLGSTETAFTEKIDMTKNPSLIMQTFDPKLFLCVSQPDEKNKKVAQLTLFNIETGRTEELIDLGYPSLSWDYSKDRKEFFITYKNSLKSNSFDILHYNIPERKSEVLSNVANNVKSTDISFDNQKLYLIKEKAAKIPAQLITLSYSPLKVQSSLKIGDSPDKLYVLGENRIALLNLPKYEYEETYLQYIDTQKNSSYNLKINLPRFYTQWFEKEKVLLISSREISFRNNSFQGSGEFFKITADTIETKKTAPWLDFEYLPKRDLLAVLCGESIQLIDYTANTQKTYSIGYNYIIDDVESKLYPYQISSIPNTDILVASCSQRQAIKFFSLVKKDLIKETSVGKWSFQSGGDVKPTMTTNPTKDRYYVMSRSTNDITVFDKDFKPLSYISISEPTLNMYEITKPNIQSIITTEKKIYKLDYEKCTLIPIFSFKEKTKDTFWIYDESDEKRLIIFSNRELVVLDSATLEVTGSIQLYGDPKQKYTKLKKGEQRYYFIKTL